MRIEKDLRTVKSIDSDSYQSYSNNERRGKNIRLRFDGVLSAERPLVMPGTEFLLIRKWGEDEEGTFLEERVTFDPKKIVDHQCSWRHGILVPAQPMTVE
jgi:hypothetical protein